jgi:CheR methyltransferase-like protein/CheB methylesterase
MLRLGWLGRADCEGGSVANKDGQKSDASSDTGNDDKLPVTVAAIGASAGGVRALQSLFSAMPDNTGAAFVVVVHLDPEHRSELVNIIAARTRMPVIEVGTLKDPPFSHIDLISCRNVLIYLDRELQEQVCSTFHYALNPGGFVFLGSSETADNPPGLFRTVDRAARIYQSTAMSGDKPRLLPRLLGPVRVREQVIQLGRTMSPAVALGEAAMHRRAIEQVAPPSMLVDESHRVIHLSENAGRFLMPSGGPLSGDAVDLVRPELRFELRSALSRVFEQRESTLSLPILVRFNGDPHRVHLLVKPVADGRPRTAARDRDLHRRRGRGRESGLGRTSDQRRHGAAPDART